MTTPPPACDPNRAVTETERYASLLVRNLLVIVTLLSAFAHGQTRNQPLTVADIIDLLKNYVPPARVAKLARDKGIDFTLSAADENRLRQAGADSALIATLKELAPKPIPVAPPPHEAPKPSGPTAGQIKVNPKDGQRYVWIPPGSFIMGCSPSDNECAYDERPAHTVTIRQGFWMGQTPVTQAAWQRVTGANPSHFKGEDLPVETISWSSAQQYCQAIGMRLPTEAEWEYAARAGEKNARYGDIDSIAWYHSNSRGRTHPVGQKQPNAWGLFDVLGNVWQWTGDWYGPYDLSNSVDPIGPSGGQFRAVRGGSWGVIPHFVRLSVRYGGLPVGRSHVLGCRCAGELP